MENSIVKFLDCTLRDGGYYNDWDFPIDLVNDYLQAVSNCGVDIVEIGFRSLNNESFKGASAYSSDDYIRSLDVPRNITIAVMVNASELILDGQLIQQNLERLFPESSDTSPVSLVRIASHVHEFETVLPLTEWLKTRGFRVGFNIMQIGKCDRSEVEALGFEASKWALDVLYFADSLGSMYPEDTADIISSLRKNWTGEIGIHAHDNLGLALQNSLRALEQGVTWLDSTVTGMGRGPGNTKTEYLAIEIAELRNTTCHLLALMDVIRLHFEPMISKFKWGTNPYYYLSGRSGIHPTYIQKMLGDSRYSEEDLLAVIDYLKTEKGDKFSTNMLNSALQFYSGEAMGSWSPKSIFQGKDVLLLGSGPGVLRYRVGLETFIQKNNPVVLALNTQSKLPASLIDVRIACHPVRLLADCEALLNFPQPLITPASMLPEHLKLVLADKVLLDFGLGVHFDGFDFHEQHCFVPKSLVFAYALAAVTSGGASRILLAGFDGYGADDPRTSEMVELVEQYSNSEDALDLIAITPTNYPLIKRSVFAY